MTEQKDKMMRTAALESFHFPAQGDRPSVTIEAASLEEAQAKYAAGATKPEKK